MSSMQPKPVDPTAPKASGPLPEQVFLPDAYRLPDGVARQETAAIRPRVVFVEVTNRCNLRCQTCPRTYFEREPLKTLGYEEFLRLAEQFPDMQRAVLHGIGEPLLNPHLSQMIRFLKSRRVQVLFNSNGTLLTPLLQEALVKSGLDEFRCSIDGARPETYARIRGANVLDRIVDGLSGLVATKARLAVANPRISIWCVVTAENLDELPDLVRLAARMGVPEVYVQRMVFFAGEPDRQYGMARSDLAMFGHFHDRQEEVVAECEALSAEYGIAFRASGASDVRQSFEAKRSVQAAPWQACLRPWTTAYVTANGNCLPCCISPFATSNYDGLILGNLFELPFSEIWNGARYRRFRGELMSPEPHEACANCGVLWSL